jgi:heme O synthase-like polyprenyltransferase
VDAAAFLGSGAVQDEEDYGRAGVPMLPNVAGDGDKKMIPAKKLFGYSLLYLFAIFTSLLVDALVSKYFGLVA